MSEDLRYACRVLSRDPGFAIPAVLALALAIAANTSVFTVIKSVLLAPLRMERPDRLAQLYSLRPDGQRYPFNIPNFLDLRERNRAFEDMAAVGGWNVNLTGEANPERLQGVRASANFFRLLGVRAALGRAIEPADGLPTSPNVVVFTWDLWQRRYGGRKDIIGFTVRLNGEPYQVVGVLPPTFIFRGTPTDLIVPLVFETDPFRAVRTSTAFLRVYGRLKPGVTEAQARAELDGVAAQLRAGFPGMNDGIVGVLPVPLQEDLTGASRQMLELLMAAVAAVLLIACANVSGLLAARASARRKDIAIRAALGGSRWRIARGFLAEGLLLSTAAGALGTLLAIWGVPLLLAISPAQLPRSAEVRLDPTVLAVSLAAAVLCGVWLGAFPAMQIRAGRLSEMLGGGRATDSPARSRARAVLVVFEVALSLVLLTAAGLALKSFHRLTALDPGFRAEDLLTMRLALPATRYRSPDTVAVFHDRLRAAIETIPGVTAVGAISVLPLSGPLAAADFTIDGRPPLSAKEQPNANYRMIDSTYFRTMQIPILRGRGFTDQDSAGGRAVAVVSSALARAYWKDADPVGSLIHIRDSPSGARQAEVVGVSGDVREVNLEQPPAITLFVPIGQIPRDLTRFLTNNFFWAVRGHAQAGVADEVRRAISAVDGDVAAAAAPMSEYVEKAIGPRTFTLRILTVFAAAALLLAASGLYALVSCATARRTRELGIRLALGARLASVSGLVVRQAVVLAAAGVALGTAAAWALARYMEAVLFEVGPHDALTVCASGLLMMALAAAASWAPARRAGRIDPVEALRSE
jgi:putative ABC transport system permease protein